MFKTTLSLITTTALLLGGCTSLQSPATDTSAIKTEKPAPSPPANLEPDILYSLLVAEMAGQRDRYDIMLGNYLSAAKKTGDPGLAERATQIAISLKAHKAALAAAQLWNQSAPNNPQAKQVLAGQLVINQKLDQAIQLLEELLASNGEASFETLTANSQSLTPAQRNELIVQLNRLLDLYPNNPQLLLSQAILLQLNGRSEEALQHAKRLYKTQPEPRSLSLTAKLNHQLGNTDKALADLNKGLKTHSKSRPLRVLYAQMLVDAKQLIKAQQQFSILLEQYPHDNQLKLTLALLSLENDEAEAGDRLLKELTEVPRMANDAYYYLGQSAQKQEQTQAAIDYYQQVQGGNRMLPAYHQLGTLLLQQDKLPLLHTVFAEARQNNAEHSSSLSIVEAELIAEQGHTTTALTLLNNALKKYPGDINLLYTRAMVTEKTNDLVAMENDLRAILLQEPDNAMVLNALGYTLADRTTRYKEALALITRAKELKPDDPAITDSLGWAQFRLGNYEEAIKLLEQAMAAFPDHEVAAHLGEALWTTGQQQRARKIWGEALQQTPDSSILKRVIERLSPDITSPTPAAN
jgi:tetratricopeptide (TPR) repeat protein